jgi:amino-acid N-acetyltransferase
MDLRDEVNLQLRAATLQDEPAVTQLLAECKLAPLDPGAQFGPQYILAVANNDRVIGVAGIERHGDDGLLRSVVVNKDFRSLRIGATLASNRVDWARDHGIRAIYLLTDTAAMYWERFGFQRIDRSTAPEGIANSHEFSVACPASSVVMRMIL